MSNRELDQLRDHDYDGITEYDNPTPGWWHLVFIGSILFSAVYIAFFHFSPMGWSIFDQWNSKKAEILKAKFGDLGELSMDEATMLRMMNDPEWLPLGESVFKQRCASCHQSDGRGNVGPNLTDDYWIHVKTLADIPRIVSEGVVSKGMPAHRRVMHVNEIVLAAAYVATLRGSNPAGAKEPEGDEIPPWPTMAPGGTDDGAGKTGG